MSLSITNESKNAFSITNEGKDDDMTWDGADPLTWDDDPGRWDAPKRPFNKEDKNSLTITNESKN
jgi:hypothetical protein